MTNTLTAEEIASLPDYIIGVNQANQPKTYGIEKTLIYAPAGGSLTNLNTSGATVTGSDRKR